MAQAIVKTVLLSVLLATTALTAFSWDSIPPCQPMFVRISYDTPDTAHTMAVTWNTRDECSTSLRVGEVGGTQKIVTGTQFKGNGNLGYIHEVHLTGLTPETAYRYEAGDGSIWSPSYTFKTGSEPNSCSPVVFAVASDSRIENIGGTRPNKWANILTEASANPDLNFVVNGGDLVFSGDEVSQWLDFLDTTPNIVAQYPLMMAIGNHDDGPVDGDGANYNQLVAYPDNPVTDSEDNYYFRYGPVLIVSISTSTFQDKFDQLAQWMSDVFEANKDAKWKIVFNHHPFYSSVSYGSNAKLHIDHPPNEEGQNPVFIPIFDKYHVDISVAAHAHYYERFAPSYGFTPKDDQNDIAPNPVDSFEKGTVYIISGGGGAMTYSNTLTSLMCRNGAPGSQACGGENHFLLFRIENNVLHMETWNTSQQLDGVDPTNFKIVDSLDIIKPYSECGNDDEPADDSDSDTLTDEDASGITDEDTTEIPDNDTMVTPDEESDADGVTDTTPQTDDEQEDTTDQTSDVPKQSESGCALLLL